MVSGCIVGITTTDRVIKPLNIEHSRGVGGLVFSFLSFQYCYRASAGMAFLGIAWALVKMCARMHEIPEQTYLLSHHESIRFRCQGRWAAKLKSPLPEVLLSGRGAVGFKA